MSSTFTLWGNDPVEIQKYTNKFMQNDSLIELIVKVKKKKGRNLDRRKGQLSYSLFFFSD